MRLLRVFDDETGGNRADLMFERDLSYPNRHRPTAFLAKDLRCTRRRGLFFAYYISSNSLEDAIAFRVGDSTHGLFWCCSIRALLPFAVPLPG